MIICVCVKRKKKGKGWLHRLGDAVDFYQKHSLLEEGSTTEAKPRCHYKIHKASSTGDRWGTLRVHFVTPTSFSHGQTYPVRGPWRVNQANPSQKYREYHMAKYGYVGSTPTGDGKVSAFKAGRNYVVTFFFEGKYADKEMELNGVSSTGIKHVKDCGHNFCMESGATIGN